MKLSRREKIMLIGGFLIVSVAAYVFYSIMPLLERQQTITTELSETRTKISTLNAQKQAMGQIGEKIVELESNLAEQTVNIPRGSNDTQLLLYINEIANRTGNVVDIRFADKPVEDGVFVVRTVSLDSLTTYDKLSQMLKELNNVELYNNVQQMSADYSVTPVNKVVTEKEAADAAVAPAVADTLNTHVELNFYAFPLQTGETAKVLLPANMQDRQKDLFPR